MIASPMQSVCVKGMFCVRIASPIQCVNLVDGLFVNSDFKPELESLDNVDTVIGGMPSDDQHKATTVTVFAEVAVQTDAGRWTS